MDFVELNQRLAAAGAPPVYFARYSPDDSVGEHAIGGYLGVAISIVDHGKYLAWGTSERSEFRESSEHFVSEGEMFDYILRKLTSPRPPPEFVSPEEYAAGNNTLQETQEWMAARKREREAKTGS